MVMFRDMTMRIERTGIAYLHYIVEGYDGLASVSTVDASAGIVRLSFDGSRQDTLDELISALRTEGLIREVRDT